MTLDKIVKYFSDKEKPGWYWFSIQSQLWNGPYNTEREAKEAEGLDELRRYDAFKR